MPESLPAPHDGLPPWERRVLGLDTKEWVIRETDCPALKAHGLRDISHTRAGAMYVVARKDWPFFMLIVSAIGRGRVTSGKSGWDLGGGQVLLVPPHTPFELRASAESWHFSILNYYPELWQGHLPAQPRLLPIHAQPVEALIEAFYREYHGDKDPVLLRQVTDILHAKIVRLTNPDQTASRLWPLWTAVLEQPAEKWSITRLARLAHLSDEHLRRLSRTEVGRSPMEQVTWLRLQEASRLLASHHHLVEEVAHRVGFESERAFRAAFQRFYSCSPSAYRQRARASFGLLNNAPHPDAPHQNVVAATPASHRYPESKGIKKWHMADLSTAANARFSAGQKPWFGDVPLLGLKPGPKIVHGVPFLIRDEAAGPSFVLLKSEKIPTDSSGRPLPSRIVLPINRRVKFAYVLHACGWGSTPGPFASYRFISERTGDDIIPVAALGAASLEEPDGKMANIQDWYFGYENFAKENARVHLLPTSRGPAATAQQLYTLRWKNPQPERKVRALEITSLPGRYATLAFLALTLA